MSADRDFTVRVRATFRQSPASHRINIVEIAKPNIMSVEQIQTCWISHPLPCTSYEMSTLLLLLPLCLPLRLFCGCDDLVLDLTRVWWLAGDHSFLSGFQGIARSCLPQKAANATPQHQSFNEDVRPVLDQKSDDPLCRAFSSTDQCPRMIVNINSML